MSKYKRFKVNIDRTSDNINILSTNKNPIWKEEILFLKLLIEGDATLYSYLQENLTRYFYETKNIKLEQLVYLKYLSDETNQEIYSSTDNIKENNQYRQQLYNNVKCDNISESDLKKVTYRKSSLVKYFSKYI